MAADVEDHRELRGASRRDQPSDVNKAGNGGWLDLSTGEILIGGVGDVDLAGNVKKRLNWAPRIGVTYQLDEKMVIRSGYGRTYNVGVSARCSDTALRRICRCSRCSKSSRRPTSIGVHARPGPGGSDLRDSETGHFRLPKGVHTGHTREAAAAGGRRVQRHRTATVVGRHVSRGRLRRQLRGASVRGRRPGGDGQRIRRCRGSLTVPA